nr:reverse transcriptase domain-containing protein [Tanacetum cinerariifolium]
MHGFTIGHPYSAATHFGGVTDWHHEPRYYQEDSAETGPSRVIIYGYDGLPIHLVALPSPYYLPRPEHPPSPNYVSGPEHPPSPVKIPYVPKPEYLEYLAPYDDEVPLKDQPLRANVSPIAASPDYVADSDPEEDPEDDQADFPADGGDGDDELSNNDDTDDDDPEEEPFEDEEDDDEEEEHLALANSFAVPIVYHVLPARGTEALEADEPTHTPGSPIIIPLSQTRLRRARKTVRLEPPMSASLKACIARHAALPSPPLLAAEIRMRALLPSTSRRTDIPEADMPPRKRACLTTSAPRFEVRESSAAGAARQPGPTELDLRRYRAQDDRALLRARVNTLFRDRPDHRRTSMLMDKEAMYAREACAYSKDRSSAIASYVRTLKAQVAALIAQTSSLQTQLTTTLGRIEILEARDPKPQEGPAEAGSSWTFVYLLAIIKMEPKKRTTRATPATTTTSTTTVTNAQLQALIDRGIVVALAECDTDRSRNALKRVIIGKYCPRDEIQKLKSEYWNLKVKGLHLLNYNYRFQELALMCERMFPEEATKVERYIGGLLDMIHGSVKASKPQRGNLMILQETTNINSSHLKGIIWHMLTLLGREIKSLMKEPNLSVPSAVITTMGPVHQR